MTVWHTQGSGTGLSGKKMPAGSSAKALEPPRQAGWRFVGIVWGLSPAIFALAYASG